MSARLPASLKSLISSPAALGSPIPSPGPAALVPVFDKIRSRAEKGGAARSAWLTLSTAATVTVNSPDSLCALYDYASKNDNGKRGAEVAGVMREVGLKCISFNGIPRTINALNVLRAHWPDEVVAQLSTEPTRIPDSINIADISTRGRSLWDGIYFPLHTKLIDKLASAHPDLPVHILNSHYGALLSDPFSTAPQGHAKIGRILTSIVAISCLRAQTGVEPQVLSHVYGLKKAAMEEGGAKGVKEEWDDVEGAEWLTSDQGAEWVLKSTDEISRAITGGKGSYAPASEGEEAQGVKAKL